MDFQGIGFALRSQAIQKVVSVIIRPKYIGTFNPPGHHVMQRSRGIKPCLSWHMLAGYPFPYPMSSCI
jgi:hypothetical protein